MKGSGADLNARLSPSAETVTLDVLNDRWTHGAGGVNGSISHLSEEAASSAPGIYQAVKGAGLYQAASRTAASTPTGHLGKKQQLHFLHQESNSHA